MQVKPLEFEYLGGNSYRAPAPLFGNIRIEQWGEDWHVNWSVPGFSDSFVHGEFIGPDEAMKAAQTKYRDLMSKTLFENGEGQADA